MDHILLEFESAGTLLEVLLVPEPRFGRKLRSVKIIANRRFPGLLRASIANRGASEKGGA
jgi:hypothetical protein